MISGAGVIVCDQDMSIIPVLHVHHIAGIDEQPACDKFGYADP